MVWDGLHIALLMNGTKINYFQIIPTLLSLSLICSLFNDTLSVCKLRYHGVK